jgi:hypothetical protein
MRKLSNNDKYFIQEHESALYNLYINTFKDILTKHAAYFIKLAVEVKDETSISNSVNNIDELAKKWHNLICPNVDKTKEFYNISRKLVYGYTNLIRDHIVNQSVCTDNINEFVRAYVRFYELLSIHQPKDMKGLWAQYTKSLLKMKNELNENGQSHNFKVYARQSIVAASLLGSKLDYLLFYTY